MVFAKSGKSTVVDEGSVFDVTKFQLDYLTTPSALLDIGIDWPKVDIRTRTKETDQLYIIAYPHFNVQGKFVAYLITLSLTALSPRTLRTLLPH